MWFFPSWLSFTFVWYLCSFMLIPDKYFHNYQSCRNPFSVVNAKHKVKVVYRIRDTEYWEKYYWQLFSMVSCKREQDLKRVWGQSRYCLNMNGILEGIQSLKWLMEQRLKRASCRQSSGKLHTSNQRASVTVGSYPYCSRKLRARMTSIATIESTKPDWPTDDNGHLLLWEGRTDIIET